MARRRSAKTFSAAVSDFARKTEARTVGVFRESSLGAAAEMSRPKSEGGHMPVLTGRLRRSLMASVSAMPPIEWKAEDFAPNEQQILDVVHDAEIGQTIYLGFRAPYAQKIELLDGAGFVRLTAQRWPEIVAEATRRVKSTTGG
jgi:hypothetical protein